MKRKTLSNLPHTCKLKYLGVHVIDKLNADIYVPHSVKSSPKFLIKHRCKKLLKESILWCMDQDSPILLERNCRYDYFLFLTGIMMHFKNLVMKVSKDGDLFPIQEYNKLELKVNNVQLKSIKLITLSSLNQTIKYIDENFNEVKELEVIIGSRNDLLALGFLSVSKYFKSIRVTYKRKVDERITRLFKTKEVLYNPESKQTTNPSDN